MVALASGWQLAVPVFRIVAGGDQSDDGFGLLSPEIWKIERFKRTTWAMAAFGMVTLVILLMLQWVGIPISSVR